MSTAGSFRTVYVGQFEQARAERIAAAMEDAGIGWTSKQFGWLTRIFSAADWGVRLYADAARVDEVQEIVERVMIGTHQEDDG